MRIFRGVLGKNPSRPKGRVRNFIANKELGTLSDIHENVINPGVTVPWHFHETEKVNVVLEGNRECRSDQRTENYSAGDVIILSARMKHSLHNPGEMPIRQICFFPGDPVTTFLEGEYPEQTVDVFNPSKWAKIEISWVGLGSLGRFFTRGVNGLRSSGLPPRSCHGGDMRARRVSAISGLRRCSK
jgi:quercetin dioxygenase-like cupin family protein